MVHIPYPLFQFLAYLTSILPYTKRMGRTYRQTIRLLTQAQNWPAEHIQAWQLERLRILIRYAIKQVPWYRETYTAAGINWHDIKRLSDMQYLPIIDKMVISGQQKSFVAQDANRSRIHEAVTSGSTGVPLRFYLPADYASREKAFLVPLLSQFGCSNDDRHLVLRTQRVSRNPRTPYWTFNPHRNQLVVSTYQMSPESIAVIAAEIRRFKPRYILAIPSIAALFSSLLMDKDENIGTPPLVVVLGSENSFRSQREHISSAFRCKTIMHYGQSEGIASAMEIEPFGPYHVNPLYSYTEIIGLGGTLESRPGKSGELIGTGFYNFAMPLIRYRTADVVTIGQGKSAWGIEGDVWERIDGRTVELVKTRDGRWIMAAALIFGTHDSTLSHVTQLQIEQRTIGCLIIRIVRGHQYKDSDEQAIRTMIDTLSKNGFDLGFEYVDAIPKTKSGKHPLLLQFLDLPAKMNE
jgi:phenylacetate-CoA ligase